jgi:hypothetical protein
LPITKIVVPLHRIAGSIAEVHITMQQHIEKIIIIKVPPHKGGEEGIT